MKSQKRTFLIQMMLSITLLILQQELKASDLIGVYPVSSDIIQLHFDDGHIDYYAEGGDWWQGADNFIYHNPLDINGATTTGNYLITGSDGSWGSVNPVQVGRKSKGGDFNAPNPQSGNPEYILEHQVYLKLPKDMISGQSYTITVGSLADNLNDFTFTFDEKTLRSETVHVNQIGFPVAAKKRAYLSHWMGDMGHLELNNYDGATFNIVRYSDKQVVHTGTIQFRREHDHQIITTLNGNIADINGPYKNQTYADVAECDFSAFSTAGEYVVAVPGIGCSYPFEISNEVVNEPFYTAMKGLFYQRANIAKQLPDGSTYLRDHHPDDVNHYYNPDIITIHDGNDREHKAAKDAFNDGTYPTNKPVNGIWGWYHDASDWDSYLKHFRIPLTLMLLYEIAPDKFYDGEIGNKYKLNNSDPTWIDEGANGIPDILDEAGWLVNYYKRARHALMDQNYGTGGCPGYVGRDAGADDADGNSVGSWNDTRDIAVTGENPTYTMAYAAIAAYYAYCLNTFHQLSNPGQNHPDYQGWINEAVAAYNWSENNGGLLATNTWGSNGLKTIAAFKLYQATGNASYLTDVESTYGVLDQSNFGIEADALPFGFISMALIEMHPAISLSVRNSASNKFNKMADRVLQVTENTGLRYGGFYEDSYGYGVFSVPKVVMPAVKHSLTNDVTFADAIMDNLSYVQGGNQLNQVYLTLLGEKAQNKAVHLIDAWMMKDFNSPVYTWRPFPGYSTYFGDDYNLVSGIGDHNWTKSSAYPLAENSPRSEMNFNNRESISGSEFTTQQTMVSWAFATGYLKAVYGTPRTQPFSNDAPTVNINLNEDQNLNNNATLTVSASSDTRQVDYYYDWHFIGSSFDKDNDFAFEWSYTESGLSPGQTVLITAVAYDDRGLQSLPTANGDASVVLAGSGDYLTTDPTNLIFSHLAGSLPFSISSNISWTLSADATWITLSDDSGSGDGTITVSVAENTSTTASRNGTITITAGGVSKYIQVTQSNAGTGFRYLKWECLTVHGAPSLRVNSISWMNGETVIIAEYPTNSSPLPYEVISDIGSGNLVNPTGLLIDNKWDTTYAPQHILCYGSENGETWTLIHEETDINGYVKGGEILIDFGTIVTPPPTPNKAPTIDAVADVSMNENSSIEIQLTGITDGDNGTQNLTVTATSENALLSATINQSYLLTLSASAVSSDTEITVTVTVKDDGGTENGGTDTKQVSFNATVVNYIPPGYRYLKWEVLSVNGSKLKINSIEWIEESTVLANEVPAITEEFPYELITDLGSGSAAIPTAFKIDNKWDATLTPKDFNCYGQPDNSSDWDLIYSATNISDYDQGGTLTIDFATGTITKSGAMTINNDDYLQESNGNPAIILYPNPVIQGEQLGIKFQQNEILQDGSLVIYDQAGRIVLNKTEILTETIKLNISNLNPGIYILSIKSKHVNINQKLILK